MGQGMDVTSRLKLETAQFDGPLDKSTHLATASANAVATANDRSAKATALAAKFAGDAVTYQSIRIVEAREKQNRASKDYSAIQALMRKGAIDEAAGVTATAAAYQRLTTAKLETARASKLASQANVSGGMAGPLAAAALGGGFVLNQIREAVSKSLEFGEALQRASENTGLAVGTLSTLHYAAAITGGDFDAMTKAVGRMDKVIGQATEGNKPALAFLEKLHLNAKQLADDPQGAEIAFRKLTSTLADTKTAVYKVQLASEFFGQRAGGQQIATLMELGNSWDELKKNAAAAGVQLDGVTARQLWETQKKMEELNQRVLGASIAFTEGFTPSLRSVMGVITSGKSKMDAMNAWGETLGRTFARVAEVIYSAGAAAEYLFSAGEGGRMTQGGRTDYAAAQEMERKADAMHGIASGDSHPALKPYTGKIVNGRPVPDTARRGTGDGDGFAGIGDQSGAASKAAQARMKGFETQLEQKKIDGDVSARAESDFWAAKKSAFAKGSSEYDAIVAKQAELALAGARAAHQKIEEFKKQAKVAAGEMIPNGMVLADESNRMNQRVAEDRAAAATEIGLARARMAAQMAEAAVHDQVGRRFNQQAAAMQLAAIHTKEYNAELAALKAQQTELAGLTKGAAGQGAMLTEAQVADLRRLGELQKEIAALEGSRQVQQQTDAFGIKNADTNALNGAVLALQEFAQTTTDASEAMKSWLGSSLLSTNQSLVKMMTDPQWQHKGMWGGTGHEIMTSATGSLLKGAEGSALKRFGIGKVDGSTAASALWVRMATLMHLPGGAAAATLPGFAAGTSAPNAAIAAYRATQALAAPGSPNMSGMVSALLPLIPHFDMGTDSVPADMLAMVHKGEQIKPYSAAPSGGGGVTTHFHVDARGSSDPAQVRVQVIQGIMEVYPHMKNDIFTSLARSADSLPVGKRPY